MWLNCFNVVRSSESLINRTYDCLKAERCSAMGFHLHSTRSGLTLQGVNNQCVSAQQDFIRLQLFCPALPSFLGRGHVSNQTNKCHDRPVKKYVRFWFVAMQLHDFKAAFL